MAEARALIAEQIEYRELLVQMTRRDLLLRYKQTIMGFGWAIFMPLVNTIIFSVVFTRVAPIDTGLPYPLYAFSRAARLELHGLVAALCRGLADGQCESRHEDLFSARGLSVLGGPRGARRQRHRVDRAGRADGVVRRRRELDRGAPAGRGARAHDVHGGAGAAARAWGTCSIATSSTCSRSS